MLLQKLLPAAIALSCLSLSVAQAQDKIYLNDGTRVDAHIREVSARDILYIPSNSTDSTEYAVAVRNVQRIVFQNGMEQSFGRNRPGPRTRIVEPQNSAKKRGSDEDYYGKNLLCFAPLQMNNESPGGLGLQYERVLDKSGHISLSIPVALSFRQRGEYDQNGVWQNHSSVFTYFYPGLKFYPASYRHRITYSIGPTFGFGFGNVPVTTDIWDPSRQQYYSITRNQSVAKGGFLINNGINFQITKAFYLGIEGGLGIYYFNNENDHFEFGGDEPMVQLNFRLGYRF